MRIDERIESRVREAFSAAIARDGDRITAALSGLDNAASAQAIGLALYACGFVVNDVIRNGPTAEEFDKLAAQIVGAERDWVQLDQTTVATFLRAASTADTSFAGLEGQDVVGLCFVCGGHLLAAFRLKDQRWWEYLNEIWAALEATPDS